jgi:hypothetical protein
VTDALTGALDRLGSTLTGITDATSANTALPTLTEFRDQLTGLESPAGMLPAAGKSTIQGVVNTALPGLQATADRLLGDGAIAGVIKPVLDDILGKLTALAG